MKFTVTSGDFSLKIEQQNHYQAAIAAFQLWRFKAKKPLLSPITTVTNNIREVFLSTPTLIKSLN